MRAQNSTSSTGGGERKWLVYIRRKTEVTINGLDPAKQEKLLYGEDDKQTGKNFYSVLLALVTHTCP